MDESSRIRTLALQGFIRVHYTFSVPPAKDGGAAYLAARCAGRGNRSAGRGSKYPGKRVAARGPKIKIVTGTWGRWRVCISSSVHDGCRMFEFVTSLQRTECRTIRRGSRSLKQGLTYQFECRQVITQRAESCRRWTHPR
jgi:hypothetical protein